MTEKILNHYDYQDIEVKKHFKWMYLDYYPCFGWDVLETMPSENRKRYLHISLRRDYDIPEKDRLTHYQSKFDNCMSEIQNLEVSMCFAPTVCAAIVGLFGIFFLMGAFSFISAGGKVGVFLMIPALAALFLAYPCYLAVFHAKQKQTEPFIRERYDELFQIGQSARKILERS